MKLSSATWATHESDRMRMALTSICPAKMAGAAPSALESQLVRVKIERTIATRPACIMSRSMPKVGRTSMDSTKCLSTSGVVLDAPAEYPQYGADYYALFFADPDGLKLEFVFRG